MGEAKRNPWGFLPQKPFPLANSSTGCTPLALGERRFTRGYIPLPHPGQTRKDRKERGHFMRLNGYPVSNRVYTSTGVT